MAEFSVHLSQANHNEGVAKFLLDKPFFDWSITACFYSAIHFFEARLFIDSADEDQKHSETSIPVDAAGRAEFSVHRWRERMVQDKFSRKAWISFRNLRESSEIARYLSYYPKTGGIAFQSAPSFSIFTVENAKFSLEKDLPNIKEELKISLSQFIYDLEMEKTDWLRGKLVSGKVLNNFMSKEALLSETKDSLRRCLTKEDIDFLDEHIRKKGLSLREDSAKN